MNIVNTPHFTTPVRSCIERFPSREACEMCSVDETFVASDSDIDTIVSICNEELVYEILFKERFQGEPYKREDAERFLAWGKEGWQRNEWFLFLLRTPQQRIVAAIDIKSNKTELAEVGYWATATYPGFMTNAVKQLCRLARDAGYRRLYALTIPENTKSASVLLRANFLRDGEVNRDNETLFHFSITL